MVNFLPDMKYGLAFRKGGIHVEPKGGGGNPYLIITLDICFLKFKMVNF